MAWQSLKERTDNLPLVLAGPILGRTAAGTGTDSPNSGRSLPARRGYGWARIPAPQARGEAGKTGRSVDNRERGPHRGFVGTEDTDETGFTSNIDTDDVQDRRA